MGHARPSLDLTWQAPRAGEAPWSCLAAAQVDGLVEKVFQIILSLSENSSTKPSVLKVLKHLLLLNVFGLVLLLRLEPHGMAQPKL